MEKVRRLAAVYYFIQGIAVIIWWLVLYFEPSFRIHFQLEQYSQTSLLAFLVPDIMLMAAGSLASSAAIILCNRYAFSAMWVTASVLAYATLYSGSFAVLSGTGWLGVTLMAPATLWSGIFASVLMVGEDMFRPALKRTSSYNLLKTFGQIIIVWSLILGIFPYLLTLLEDQLGISRYTFTLQEPISIVLFVLASSVGVWAAISMSKVGGGTPLPLDHATRMVISGPYAFVRNPMALSGIAQGLVVALYYGSPLVAVYALMGSAIWQFVFRSLEEDDLLKRFGDEFKDYMENVRCWIPNLKPYQKGNSPASSISIDLPSGRM